MAEPELKRFIFDLPNEILTQILELVARTEEINPITPVLFVCRRFCQLGIPFQYKRLKLDYGNDFRSAEQLYRTLQKNPGLGKYCCDLMLTVQDKYDIYSKYNKQFQDFQHFITSTLTNVHSLEIEGGFSRPQQGTDWNLLRSCVASMPSLRTVSLMRNLLCLGSGKNVEPDVHPVMDALGGSLVRSLALSGFIFSSSPLSHCTSQVFEPTCITELRLDSSFKSPELLSSLLDWPQTLTSLKIGGRRHDSKRFMDMLTLGSMLEKHKETLVRLSIGKLSQEGSGKLFDFATFTRLEELGLVMNEVVPYWPADFGDMEYRLLLPPKLRMLKVGFVDLDLFTYICFDNRAGSWLRGFAKAAACQKIPLREIAIVIPVDLFPKRSRAIARQVWGNLYARHLDRFWDGIDALEKDLRSMGIALTVLSLGRYPRFCL